MAAMTAGPPSDMNRIQVPTARFIVANRSIPSQLLNCTTRFDHEKARVL